jgi:cytochrome bd-type quinol oxidase subunit 2
MGPAEHEEDAMSSRTIYLGRLIGLYCLFVALAMISHKRTTVDTMTALVHDAPVLFLACLLALVAGLAIVLAHNVWSGGALPVVVTLFGWIVLIKGLIFLLLPPDTSLAYFEAARYGQFFYFYMTIDLVIGIYLTFASFRSSKRIIPD